MKVIFLFFFHSTLTTLVKTFKLLDFQSTKGLTIKYEPQFWLVNMALISLVPTDIYKLKLKYLFAFTKQGSTEK